MRLKAHVCAAVIAGSSLAVLQAAAQQPQPPATSGTTPPPSATPAPTAAETARPPVVQQPPQPQAQPPAPQQYAPSYPPGYGQQPYPPGYGQQAYPPQSYPPGYGPPVYGQPAYGPPTAYGYGPYAGPIAPPPPMPEPGIREHDGFYLRMGLGIGHMSSTLTPDDGSGDIELSGSGVAFDFAMGGAIVPGFILAGRLQGINAYNPSYEDSSGSTTDDTDLMLSTIQIATDIYPMPKKGLHFMGSVGPATLSFRQKNSYSGSGMSSDYYDSSSVDGIALSLGAGWETWVGNQWSIGGMIGLNWAWMRGALSPYRVSGNSSEADMKVFAPTASFTATYN